MNDQEKAVISQLNKIYSIIANEFATSSIAGERVINTHDLALHGTNGFAFLLACLTGKTLLPGDEREKLGIPTVTGEAAYNIAIGSKYHSYWKYFVSSLPFDAIDAYTLRRVLGYATQSCNTFKCDYNDFVTKFSNILSSKNLHNLFEDINKEELYRIYNKLSSIPVVIIGNGSGHASSIKCGISGENRYESIDIIGVITLDDSSIIPELINTLQANMITIEKSKFTKFWCTTSSEFNDKLCIVSKLIEDFGKHTIKEIQQKNEFKTFVELHSYDNITDFVKTYGSIELLNFILNHPRIKSIGKYFVNLFANHLSDKFYSSNQTATCIKEFMLPNEKEIDELQQVTIEYSVPLEEVQELHTQDLQENNNEFVLSGAHVDTCSASELMYI